MSSKGLVVFLAAISGLLFLSFEIDAFYAASVDKEAVSMPVILRVIGESRDIASNLMFLQADAYYHRGVVHRDCDHGKSIKSGIYTDHSDNSVPSKEGYAGGNRTVSLEDPLLWISNELLLDSHAHIGTEDLEEIVPWLYLANKLDPHNISAYTVTAYYLADRFGKAPEALSLLKKGLSENPGSWQISAAIGRVMSQNLEDNSSAIKFLERADVLMRKGGHDRFDGREVLTLLAHAYLETGNEKNALDVFSRLLILFPESKTLGKKISELELIVLSRE